MTTRPPQPDTALRGRCSSLREPDFAITRISPTTGRSPLVVTGALDIATAPQLHAALNAETAQHVVVEISAVPVLCTDGTDVLAAAAQRQADGGGILLVAGARPLAPPLPAVPGTGASAPAGALTPPHPPLT